MKRLLTICAVITMILAVSGVAYASGYLGPGSYTLTADGEKFAGAWPAYPWTGGSAPMPGGQTHWFEWLGIDMSGVPEKADATEADPWFYNIGSRITRLAVWDDAVSSVGLGVHMDYMYRCWDHDADAWVPLTDYVGGQYTYTGSGTGNGETYYLANQGVHMLTLVETQPGPTQESLWIPANLGDTFDLRLEVLESSSPTVTGYYRNAGETTWIQFGQITANTYTHDFAGGGGYVYWVVGGGAGTAEWDNLGSSIIIPALTCSGFEPPMDKGAVKVKKNRVLPLKAELSDEDGYPVTDADITAAPLIQVMFRPVPVDGAEDVTDEALSVGQGTEGNEFEFSGGKWQFNLQTKKYTAAGTYTITMVSGDTSEYFIHLTCEAQFVIE